MFPTISAHMHHLTSRLELLSDERRLAFAGWCTQTLMDKALPFVSCRISTDKAQQLTHFMRAVWNDILKNEPLDEQLLAQIQNFVDADIEWDPDDIGDDEQLQEYVTIELFNSLEWLIKTYTHRASLSAARTASCVFNYVDFELGAKYGENYTEQTISDPLMTTELALHDKVIDYLSQTTVLGDELVHLYRTSRSH